MALSGELSWSGGLPHGTYSTHGFDGSLVVGNSVIYWDNLENGAQFSQSAIWVEESSAVASPYEEWASGHGLSGIDAELSADPDSDGLGNLTEYGLGGNPDDPNDTGIRPVFAIADASGTQWFEYTYRRRVDAAARGLSYDPELNVGLAPDAWTGTGYNVVATSTIDAEFESVTIRVPMDTFPTQFIRLRIGLE